MLEVPGSPGPPGGRVLSTRSIVKVLLVAAALAACLYLLYLIRQVVGAFVIAVFLAVALGPAVDFFNRRRIPRGLSILIVYVLILGAMFGVGLLVVPPIVDQIDRFVRDIPGYVDDLRNSETIRDYDNKYGITDKLREQAERLPARLGDAAGALQSVTVGIFSALFQLVTILVMTFFLLLEGKTISNFAFAQLRPDVQPRARAVAGRVYKAVGGYVTGAFTIALIAGVSAYAVLSIAGVEFAVPLAVLMAFLDLIPLIGATIAGVLIAAVAALTAFPTGLIVWGVFFLIYQQVENNVLQPFVYRRTVALHPLVVIVAVLIGASLLGVLGALLAIPVAAAAQILVKDWWRFRTAPASAVAAGEAADEQAPRADPKAELEKAAPDPA